MNWIKIEWIGFWLERPSDYRWRLSGPLAGDEPGPLGLSNSRAQCATTNTKRTRVETMRRCRWSLEGSRLAVASTEKWSPLTSDSSTWFPPTIFWRQDNNRPRLVWRFLHFSSSFSFSSLLSCMKLVVLLAVATRQRSPFCFPIFHSSWVGFFFLFFLFLLLGVHWFMAANRLFDSRRFRLNFHQFWSCDSPVIPSPFLAAFRSNFSPFLALDSTNFLPSYDAIFSANFVLFFSFESQFWSILELDFSQFVILGRPIFEALTNFLCNHNAIFFQPITVWFIWE